MVMRSPAWFKLVHVIQAIGVDLLLLLELLGAVPLHSTPINAAILAQVAWLPSLHHVLAPGFAARWTGRSF
jgi:hypothetical protein